MLSAKLCHTYEGENLQPLCYASAIATEGRLISSGLDADSVQHCESMAFCFFSEVLGVTLPNRTSAAAASPM